jgi:hypothetical protein
VILQLIPLATSVVTVIGIWLAGNHDPRGWMLGIANQALWLWFIIAFGAWGLLPLLVVLLFTYSRNLVKWRKEGR